MSITEDFHKLAADIDLTPTQAEAMLDFTIANMIRAIREKVPEEDINMQAKKDLEASKP